MNIPFVKMSGAGNDFIVVDRLGDATGPGAVSIAAAVPAMCDRRKGIGGDGVIVLSPADGADFAMDYYNADGSSGSLCGNGGRCAASYVMDRRRLQDVRFLTCGRLYGARRAGKGVVLEMDDPGPLRKSLVLRTGRGEAVGHFIDTGSPHLVLALDTPMPDARTILETGRELRHHPDFRPSGTNVDFMTVESRDVIRVRTYERGVEDETWACGTGAVASAMVHSVLNGPEGPGFVRVVPLSGDELIVGFTRTGERFTNVTLEGPAVVTFTGTFEIR